MWEYMELPPDGGDAERKELLVRQCAAEKMREYDGTVFLCCSPRDKERMNAFAQAAQDAGREVKDEQLMETEAGTLAESAGKNAFFVSWSMQESLARYLAACPAGARHLLL